MTVNTKLLEVVRVPSLTMIVMVEVPLRPVAGVITAVRPAPLPPNTIFPFGMSVRLDDVPETASRVAAVSTSPIVNVIGGVAVSSTVVAFAIVATVGGSLLLATVS